MSSHLNWCDTVLYKQNIVTEQSKNNHCLRKVSVQSKLLLINLKNRIDISVCKSENNNVSIIQDKSPTSCQLWDTYLYDIYIMMIVVVVVAAELVIQESVLKYVNQKRFHIQEMRGEEVEKERKRDLRWEGYNSLHWQVNSSELSKKTMCQQMIKNFHLWILLI